MRLLNFDTLRLFIYKTLRLFTYNTLRLFLLFNFVLLVLFSNAYAAPVKIVYQNDVRSIAQLRYQIGRSDPYWIFDALDLDPELRTLQLPITLNAASLSNGGKSNEDIELEVFYKPQENNSNTNNGKILFNPFHKLKYSFAIEKLSELGPALIITIILPKEIEYSENSKLRLDINNCSGCEIDFAKENSGTNKTNEDLSGNLKNIRLTPSVVMDGIKLMETPTLELNHTAWRLHDLKRIEDRLKIIGNDPYLLSPQFAISTSTLGGVLVKLSFGDETNELEATGKKVLIEKLASEAKTSLANIQLFYRTELHPFTEEASTIVGVPLINDGIEQSFFIPLDFISTQKPIAELLTGLRLDFDQISQLNSISLVDKETAQKYRPLIPSKFYQRKFQHANLRLLASTTFKNLTQDLGFIIFYAVLLILVAIGFRRAYTR